MERIFYENRQEAERTQKNATASWFDCIQPSYL